MIKSIRPRSWVSCPLGINHLLSLVKGNKSDAEKYNQIGCQLQKKECYYRSKLFAKSSNKIGDAMISDTEITDDPLQAFTQFAEKNMTTKNIIKISESDFFLVNISTFKGSWNAAQNGALMKVYNTFNYTQDVKYEARLLELPMKNDFGFIIIVPNENDVLQSLFQRFYQEGLASALKSIQPVFVVCSDINAPSIRVHSEILSKGVTSTTDNVHLSQYGYIDVNDTGAHIEVLSCIYTAHSKNKQESLVGSTSPFFFGLVHEDMAIFIGQYFPVK